MSENADIRIGKYIRMTIPNVYPTFQSYKAQLSIRFFQATPVSMTQQRCTWEAISELPLKKA